MKKLFLFAILSLFFWTHDPVDVQARVRLPQHIASGMVLQRGQPLTLHGRGDAGENIVLAFRGKKYRATTDAQGLWQITLPAQKPGGPYTMRVNDTTLTDVWVGDVILCAGQSNMELPVSRVVDLPDVGLAVTLGTGEWNDIHPLDKKTVADRVARQLFRLAYGENVTTAPMVEGACCQGDTIVLQFDNGGSPLFYEDSLRGFSVQGKDGRHAWARVLAVGDDTVTLLSPVDTPRRVRYAWADNPGKPLLRNKEGLPASPFEIEIDSETPTP